LFLKRTFEDKWHMFLWLDVLSVTKLMISKNGRELEALESSSGLVWFLIYYWTAD